MVVFTPSVLQVVAHTIGASVAGQVMIATVEMVGSNQPDRAAGSITHALVMCIAAAPPH